MCASGNVLLMLGTDRTKTLWSIKYDRMEVTAHTHILGLIQPLQLVQVMRLK